jgi:hypothetical protein
MATTQHTPGPWELDDTKKYYRRGTIRHNGQIVATVSESITHRDGERDANARLIAQAWRIPEMLELLACLTGYVEARWHVADGAAPIKHAEDARALLRAVEG